MLGPRGTGPTFRAEPALVGEGYAGVARAGTDLCAWTTAGGVQCWGGGVTGAIADLHDVVEVTGAQPTCARRRDGSVACWNVEDGTPVTEVAVTNAVQLAAGFGHACALTQPGDVQCWSGTAVRRIAAAHGAISLIVAREENSLPQEGYVAVALLGDGALVGWKLPGDEPVTLPRAREGAVRLEPSEGRVFVLDRDGNTSVVGLDGSGPKALYYKPAIELADGGSTMCFHGRDGTASCSGEVGMFGDGRLPFTRDAVAVPGCHDAVQLAADVGRACVRLATGFVVCWNADDYGGQPQGVQPSDPPDSIDLVVANQMCVLRKGGHVTCWPNLLQKPHDVAVLEGSERITRIGGFVCGVAKGVTTCVGIDGAAIRTPDVVPPEARPEEPKVGPLIARAQLVPPDSSPLDPFAETCGLRAAGTVVCWSAKGVVREVAGVTDGVEIASLGAAICVRERSGAVACWGQRELAVIDERSFVPDPIVAPHVEMGRAP